MSYYQNRPQMQRASSSALPMMIPLAPQNAYPYQHQQRSNSSPSSSLSSNSSGLEPLDINELLEHRVWASDATSLGKPFDPTPFVNNLIESLSESQLDYLAQSIPSAEDISRATIHRLIELGREDTAMQPRSSPHMRRDSMSRRAGGMSW